MNWVEMTPYIGKGDKVVFSVLKLTILGVGLMLREAARINDTEDGGFPPGSPAYLNTSKLDLLKMIQMEDLAKSIAKELVDTAKAGGTKKGVATKAKDK